MAYLRFNIFKAQYPLLGRLKLSEPLLLLRDFSPIDGEDLKADAPLNRNVNRAREVLLVQMIFFNHPKIQFGIVFVVECHVRRLLENPRSVRHAKVLPISLA